MFNGWVDGLFSVFFPDCCRLCEAPLTALTAAPVCQACFERLVARLPGSACAICGVNVESPPPDAEAILCAACRRSPPAFDRALSWGLYEGPLRALIHLLKYDGIEPLGHPLGNLLAQAARADDAPDIVVPAPLHWRRRRSRGFNQSALVARTTARVLGVRCETKLLRRTRPTQSQAGLNRAERAKNLRGAFAVRRPESIEGKTVGLVDDVLTTGATASACAEVLKAAGAVRVHAWTLARAESLAGAG